MLYKRTCKQIRTECLPLLRFKILLYDTNTDSDLQGAEHYTSAFRRWMKALGPWKSCLGSLDVGLIGPPLHTEIDEQGEYKWYRASSTLRDTCNPPKLQLTMSLQGLSRETVEFDCELILRIFGDQANQALRQFERDVKELEAHVMSDVSSGSSLELAYYIVNNALPMIVEVRHIVRMYAKKLSSLKVPRGSQGSSRVYADLQFPIKGCNLILVLRMWKDRR